MNHECVKLVSMADRDNPFWANKKHVAAELAPRGHRVFDFNLLGLRRPGRSASDAREISLRLVIGLHVPLVAEVFRRVGRPLPASAIALDCAALECIACRITGSSWVTCKRAACR